MEEPMDRNVDADLPLLQATMRVNTLIFGIIFGLLAGLALLALALAAADRDHGHAPLLVALLGVFLPGYAQGWLGALAGLVWGCVLGSALAAGIYRINCRVALARVDDLVAMDGGSGEFPVAVLRLHGPSLGIAIGAIGGLGLIVTTNWLVLRGTAAESVHAQLVAHFLPRYAVDLPGSLIGAAELFVILYVSSLLFASIYNRVVALRQRRD